MTIYSGLQAEKLLNNDDANKILEEYERKLAENNRKLKELEEKENESRKSRRKRIAIHTIIFLVLVVIILNFYDTTYRMIAQDQTNDRIKDLFKEFAQKYDKKYASGEERLYRFEIFKSNVLAYEEEEKKQPGLDLDVTQFADLTNEELKQLLLGYEYEKVVEGETSTFNTEPLDVANRPDNFDWTTQGKVSDVKNQQQCGSCWAFATVAAVESALAIKNGSLMRLSEQEMVDCDRSNNGCHGGVRAYAMRFVQRNGLVAESLYPYTAEEGDVCRVKGGNQSRIFINSYQLLGKDEEKVADWLYSKGPITFGMNVTRFLYYYRDGIFTPDAEDCKVNSLGSHAMTIVGYGTDNGKLYYVVKNSWGKYWGRNGYFKLARGINACGMANNIVAPII